MEIKTLGVVGAGQMGSGIAQVAAASGLSVIMSDIKDEFVQRGANAIRDSLGRLVKKEKMTAEDRQAILGRITGTTSLADMAKADFVVEAATENETLKLKIFTDLDSICRPGVILSSNTSSISITKIAGATKRPEKYHRYAFHEPCSHDEAGGDHQRSRHLRGDLHVDEGSLCQNGKDACAR